MVVGVVLLIWGADAAARVGAESLLERNIQAVTGVAQRPEVRLVGGPVLAQAIRGAYDGADVNVVGVQSGPLRLERVQAHLSDVRMPLREVILRDLRPVGIGRSAETVTLTFTDLNAYFRITGRSVRLSGRDDGQVRMTASFSLLRQPVEVTGPVELSVDGSQLRITPGRVDTGGVALSRARRLLLDQRLNLTVPLDTLPIGHDLTGVTADREALTLTAESTLLVLRP